MAFAVEVLTTLLTVGGLIYMLLALFGARRFERETRAAVAALAAGAGESFAPDVSILKPLKGLDPRMYASFASHCTQQYAGRYELLFGVNSLEDPAAAEIHRLQAEYPNCAIRLVECSERLGTSGKVSSLIQLLRKARYDYILINDSDIRVGPRYLARIMRQFAAPGGRDPRTPADKPVPVGLVTAPYLGRTAREGAAGLTLWSRLEALGISTDFIPGVLTARMLERGIRFGLGSTLAVSREALNAAGGLEPLLDVLADDYELGARIARAGFRVELAPEVVETTIPAYDFRGFRDHQLRWARSTRDSRRFGYLGLGVTYCIPWAVLNCVTTGFALWSFTLLSLVLLARISVALTVGVGILRDEQVLRDIWLIPLRDFFGLAFWAWSYASDTVVWRGDRFRLTRGHIVKVE
jgi:ceramide glucosyltransferase